jgi:hypothetical protein
MNDDFNRKRMEKFSQMSETERNNMMAIAGSYRTLTPEEVGFKRPRHLVARRDMVDAALKLLKSELGEWDD